MALRYLFGQAPYEKEMTEDEIRRECEKVRRWHRLKYKRGSSIALCSCGNAFQAATKQNINWRFESHVHQAVELFENKLRGISHGD